MTIHAATSKNTLHILFVHATIRNIRTEGERFSTMPIKSNLDKHTVSWLIRQDTEGKLNKNISIQRKEVWDAERKSNLVVSFLLGIPIESLLFEETEDESYNVLDGKQRTLTLCAYTSDEFALSPKIRLKEIDGQPLVGLMFSELSDAMRNRILDYELSISVLRPLEENERATVFFMRNQAAALSKMDLSRVLLGEQYLSEFQKLCTHPFLTDKIKLTEPARRKNEDLLVLLQYLLLLKRPDAGFSGVAVMSLCDDINSGEIDLSDANLSLILTYLDDAFTEKRQYFKKAHIPVAMYVANQAIEKGFLADSFAPLLDEFFENLEPDGEYMTACKSGSSKRTNVQARLRIMSEILEKNVHKNEKEPKTAKKTQKNRTGKK